MSVETAKELRILIVDDNPSDRALVIRELKREYPRARFIEVTRMEELDQALGPAALDLVVSDYQLHWTNGLEVLAKVRQRAPYLPMILFTATGTQEIAVEAMKQGLDDYVLKSPAHFVRLKSATRAALQKTALRVRAERLEKRLGSLLDQLRIGVFRLDDMGMLLEANAAFLKILGTGSLDEVRARDLGFLKARPPDPDATEWEREERVSGLGDKVRWLRVHQIAARLEGKRYFDGTLEDVTEQKELEAELKASNEELERYAFAASHDLKEPLRMVTLYIQLLGRRYRGKLDAEAEQYLDYIEEGAKRMYALTDNLQLAATLRRHREPLAPIDLESVIADANEILKRSIAELGARIEVGPLPRVLGNRPLLVQLFRSLLENSLKFRAGEPPHVRIAATPYRDRRFLISVRDNGIGIEPQYLDRVFVMFQRFHHRERYPGTGIGLAVCKQIVRRHGGEIWVRPGSPGGACFEFTLAEG